MQKSALSCSVAPHRAFSLAEVTIALGLATFAVLSVAGLLPLGLGTLRDSKVQMLETQILRDVSAQNAVGDYTNVSYTAWFDNDGQRTSGADGAVFRIDVREVAGQPIYPGSDQAFDLGASLKAVRVEIQDLRTQARRTNHLWLPRDGR
jgi:Verrucomicrobium spinosum paralogous family TIGR02598